VTLTLHRESIAEYFHREFEDELTLEIRLAGLVVALSDCSTRTAFRLVRRHGRETPLERLARALAAARRESAAA
jgi:hypothetical protein